LVLLSCGAEAEHFSEEGVGGLHFGFELFYAFEEAFGVGAAFAQGGHGDQGVFFAWAEARAAGGVGGDFLADLGGGEFLRLAGKFGDDEFGGAFADAIELDEGAGVFGFDGLGDFADGNGEGSQGGLRADAFDGGEEGEELFVLGGSEADELGIEIAAACGALEIEEGVEGNFLADLCAERADIGGGDEEFVGHRPDLKMRRGGRFEEGEELAGEGDDHGDILSRLAEADTHLLRGLLTRFFAAGHGVSGHFARGHGSPVYCERSFIAEERPPDFVGHFDLDAVALGCFIVPFADISDAGEEHRELEGDGAFVEALCAAAEAQASGGGIDGEIDIDRQMLMGAEVVDDLLSALAVDHVGIEAARAAGLKGP